MDAAPDASGTDTPEGGRHGNGAGDGDGGRLQEELESLCMNCHEQGTTRILLMNIPHFREVLVMAFDCPHCYARNNEVQFAGQLAPTGCRYTLQVPANSQESLDRQVVKSDSATVSIPELEFEIPPESQAGTLSTLEGVLTRALDGLRTLQDERRRADPAVAEALDAFLSKLEECATGRRAFQLVLDDPSGNSFIENPNVPTADPLLTVEHYKRTAEQSEALGYKVAAAEGGAAQWETGAAGEAGGPATGRPLYVPAGTTRRPHGSVGAVGMHASILETSGDAAELLKYSSPEEVMVFPATCSTCGARTETRMYQTSIPYFREVIVMATSCDECGYRNSELKAGGSISEKGRRIALRVKTPADLSRDVIKSDTAAVAIPEIELELAPGTLGGRVTTVEGLVDDISTSLKKVQAFSIGDSAPDWKRRQWLQFDENLRRLLEVEEEWTLILDDALACSFVAPLTDVKSLEDDLQLTTEDYERSFEQNEDLGLNDMDTAQGASQPEGEPGSSAPDPPDVPRSREPALSL